MLQRRMFLRGLVAAPAVVAIGSLMPIRGVRMLSVPTWLPRRLVDDMYLMTNRWDRPLNAWLVENGYPHCIEQYGARIPNWLHDIWERDSRSWAYKQKHS